MSENPKVTIIVPVFNGEQYVEESITSAFNQTYENLEIISVDNESTDDSLNILHKLKEKYPALIVDTAPNIYPYTWDEPRDKAFEHMTGEYFMILPADDAIDPKFIETAMRIMANTEILAMQSPIRFFGTWNHEQKYAYSNMKEFRTLLNERCVVNTPSVVWKASILDNPAFETKPDIYAGAGDYWLYCSLADAGIMVHSFPKWIGFNYRIHDKQATWGMQKTHSNAEEEIRSYWEEKWKR